MTRRVNDEQPELDRGTLTGPVRRALRSDRAKVITWQLRSIAYANTAQISGGIYRVASTAHDRGDVRSWSCVLKIVRASAGCDDPGAEEYWAREILAYRSGALAKMAPGLTAPECYGVVDMPRECVWVWLEEITDACGPRWPLSCYIRAVEHLGRFNGAYLTGRSIPFHPWLGGGWLRSAVDASADAITRLPKVANHPLVRRAYPPHAVVAFARLWEERAVFLAALAALPRTFCHGDAWRHNLFLRQAGPGDDELLAVDWAMTNIGAVGEELAPLVAASVFFEDEVALLPHLNEAAFAAYVVGLRAAGWQGDERAARLGYAASSVLRYGLGWLIHIVNIGLDEEGYAACERLFGGTIADIMDRFGGLNAFLLERAGEVRALLDA